MTPEISNKTNTELLIEIIQSIPDAKLAHVYDHIYTHIGYGLDLSEDTYLYATPSIESFDPAVLNAIQSKIYGSFKNRSELINTRKWNLDYWWDTNISTQTEGVIFKKMLSKKLYLGRFEIREVLDLDLDIRCDITINESYVKKSIDKIRDTLSLDAKIHENKIITGNFHYKSLMQDRIDWPYHAQFKRVTTVFVMPGEEYVHKTIGNIDVQGLRYPNCCIDLLNKNQ